MNPLSVDCSTLRRFIAEHLGVPSTIVPAFFPVVTCLAVLAVLANPSCVSLTPSTPPSTPTPHRKPTKAPTEIPTPTPTVTPTPTPALLPPVTLEAPEDGARLACGTDVELRWNCPYSLQEDEIYQLAVKGPDFSRVQCEKDCFTIDEPPSGEYSWAVAVVRSDESGGYLAASEESDWYSFEILPPPPVVRSISPTSIAHGIIRTVTIRGEDFAHSLCLTIGVPLEFTVVNSSTITATIPATLEVGEHSVILEDSAGKGVSTVSFIVKDPVPTKPVYLPPELAGPDIMKCNVTFRWSWSRELAEDEYYAVRFGIGDPGHSKVWVKDLQYIAVLQEPGEYTWEVGVCQGELGTGICNQLAVSKQQTFEFRGCGGW